MERETSVEEVLDDMDGPISTLSVGYELMEEFEPEDLLSKDMLGENPVVKTFEVGCNPIED